MGGPGRGFWEEEDQGEGSVWGEDWGEVSRGRTGKRVEGRTGERVLGARTRRDTSLS